MTIVFRLNFVSFYFFNFVIINYDEQWNLKENEINYERMLIFVFFMHDELQIRPEVASVTASADRLSVSI